MGINENDLYKMRRGDRVTTKLHDGELSFTWYTKNVIKTHTDPQRGCIIVDEYSYVFKGSESIRIAGEVALVVSLSEGKAKKVDYCETCLKLIDEAKTLPECA